LSERLPDTVGLPSEKGTDVAERPVYPPDLISSMYELLGIDPDPDGAMPNPRGLQVKVMPPSEKGTGRLTEIM
jgi:hypothetical protein